METKVVEMGLSMVHPQCKLAKNKCTQSAEITLLTRWRVGLKI